MDNYNLINGSLLQSAFNLIDKILSDYAILQPDFKYKLYYGTNYDTDYSFENDMYHIIMGTGTLDKIPSHFTEINGIQQLLYAGYLDVGLSIINPISTRYIDDLKLTEIIESQITDDLNIQTDINTDVNLLSEDDINKIEKGTRLLEGLSLFLTKKNIIIDNFNFTTRADAPLIEGQYEVGIYRLLESIGIVVKFTLLNDFGKSLISGENYKVWFNFKENGEYTNTWEELYNILDFTIENTLNNKQYPLSPLFTLQQLPNQIGRICLLNAPELEIGASKKIKEIIYNGDIEALKKVKIKYYDGIKFRQFEGIISDDTRTTNIDRFNSLNLSINITTEIIEV